MAQKFKGDALEDKFYNSAAPVLAGFSSEHDDFFNDAYACFVLGELIYDNELSPLANAIPRDIFRESFAAIYESFRFAGSFESYIEVFKKVFGDDVDVTFTVPAPGKLEIDIIATGIEVTNFVVRRIENNTFVLYQLITQDGADNIVLQSIKGLESQYELEQMLFEMVPAGVYTVITLSFA